MRTRGIALVGSEGNCSLAENADLSLIWRTKSAIVTMVREPSGLNADTMSVQQEICGRQLRGSSQLMWGLMRYANDTSSIDVAPALNEPLLSPLSLPWMRLRPGRENAARTRHAE